MTKFGFSSKTIAIKFEESNREKVIIEDLNSRFEEDLPCSLTIVLVEVSKTVRLLSCDASKYFSSEEKESLRELIYIYNG